MIACVVSVRFFSRRTEVEAYDVVIVGIILVFCRPNFMLFNLGSIFSYVSTYFAIGIDIICESLAMPIYFSSIVDNSLRN